MNVTEKILKGKVGDDANYRVNGPCGITKQGFGLEIVIDSLVGPRELREVHDVEGFIEVDTHFEPKDAVSSHEPKNMDGVGHPTIFTLMGIAGNPSFPKYPN